MKRTRCQCCGQAMTRSAHARAAVRLALQRGGLRYAEEARIAREVGISRQLVNVIVKEEMQRGQAGSQAETY